MSMDGIRNDYDVKGAIGKTVPYLTETLAEITELLASMGLRHDTFVVGDGGKIAGPHEAIRTLVQKAAEGQQVLDELGL